MTEEELHERIDHVARELYRVELEMKAEFRLVDERFNTLEAKIDQFDQRLGALDHKMMLRFDEVNVRIDGLENRISQGFGDLGKRIDRLGK